MSRTSEREAGGRMFRTADEMVTFLIDEMGSVDVGLERANFYDNADLAIALVQAVLDACGNLRSAPPRPNRNAVPPRKRG